MNFVQILYLFKLRSLFKFLIPNCSDFRKEKRKKQKKKKKEINWEASLTELGPSMKLHGRALLQHVVWAMHRRSPQGGHVEYDHMIRLHTLVHRVVMTADSPN
jgi:hypothetical protein